MAVSRDWRDMRRLRTHQRVRGRDTAAGSASSPAKAVSAKRSSAPLRRPEQGTAEQARADQQLLGEDAPLPASYGETKVILVPVHPFLVHAYWDLSPEHVKEILSRRRRRGGRGLRPVLRFYDTTGPGDAGDLPSGTFDVDVDLGAMNWYVHVWKSARSYIVELGLKTAQGGFIPIARSNGAQVPPAGPSDNLRERYLLVKGGYSKVEPVTPAVSETPPQAHSAPEAVRDARGDFSEPAGWFIASEPKPVSGEPMPDVPEDHAVPAPDVSSPFSGRRKAR